MPTKLGTCTWCNTNPGDRLGADGDPMCRDCYRGLLEQEREEDEPDGEWDSAEYYREDWNA